MPFYHKPREFTPLLIAAHKKSIKNGLRHAIFTSRFDKYIGDWKNDKKEGTYNVIMALLHTNPKIDLLITLRDNF